MASGQSLDRIANEVNEVMEEDILADEEPASEDNEAVPISETVSCPCLPSHAVPLRLKFWFYNSSEFVVHALETVTVTLKTCRHPRKVNLGNKMAFSSSNNILYRILFRFAIRK